MTKILVIEDELFVRENIVELLEAEDFEVFSTENGILGILWANDNLPDLVICDVMMPEINGHEILAEMRELPTTSLIPFIFLTAMADKQDIRHGMELGADDYLTKPFTREELLGAINTRLVKQKQLMQRYDKEHERAEILAQKVQKLESMQIPIDIFQQDRQKYQQALLKIETAINLINKIQPGQKRERFASFDRDRNIKIIQETCAQEISLLKRIPYIEAQICSKDDTIAAIFQS